MNIKTGIGIGAFIILVGLVLLTNAYLNNSSYTAGILTSLFGIGFIIKVLGK
tara:strand:- start:367 stop:522 length:156 start_codon:yes stop_codon:yes gene_type:complete